MRRNNERVNYYISIHAAQEGCDNELHRSSLNNCKFQSTQPEWAATCYLVDQVRGRIFQSTQPEWAATVQILNRIQYRFISIHAARVGCDCAVY